MDSKWTNSGASRFINACLKDKGMPRFRVKASFEKDKKGKTIRTVNDDVSKLTAYCWGGLNQEPHAETVHFSDVPKNISALITDPIKPDWPQIAKEIHSPTLQKLADSKWKLLYEVLQPTTPPLEGLAVDGRQRKG